MHDSIDLAYPFNGRWLVQNSPANRVPSHGTHLFASAYAIDFVPVAENGRTARFTWGSLWFPEPPELFPGFGRIVLAPVDGVVVGAYDAERDHPAYRGFPSLRYAGSQRRRASSGWSALAGNHVLIESDGIVVALCHLQHSSLRVSVGSKVRSGDVVGLCGNSGNSTEPHLHLQAGDSADPGRARAIGVTFRGSLPRNGQVVCEVGG